MQKEFIKKIYVSSPDVIQDAISSDELANKITELGSENGLNSTQKNLLGNEITLRLIGITKKDSFVKKLVDELKINEQISSNISISFEKFIYSLVPEKILIAQEGYVQSKINSVEFNLQSIPEVKPAETALAPTVIAEKQNDLPMIVVGERPKTALTFEERKKLVPNIPDNKSHYEGGVDPYREQF